MQTPDTGSAKNFPCSNPSLSRQSAIVRAYEGTRRKVFIDILAEI